MMAHELWLIKGGTMTNITPLLGTLTWRSNMEELGTKLILVSLLLIQITFQ